MKTNQNHKGAASLGAPAKINGGRLRYIRNTKGRLCIGGGRPLLCIIQGNLYFIKQNKTVRYQVTKQSDL